MRGGENMRDFFEDSEKVTPKEEKTENTDSLSVNEVKKIVGVEVKKAIDTFINEWNKNHKEEVKDEEKEEKEEKEEC